LCTPGTSSDLAALESSLSPLFESSSGSLVQASLFRILGEDLDVTFQLVLVLPSLLTDGELRTDGETVTCQSLGVVALAVRLGVATGAGLRLLSELLESSSYGTRLVACFCLPFVLPSPPSAGGGFTAPSRKRFLGPLSSAAGCGGELVGGASAPASAGAGSWGPIKPGRFSLLASASGRRSLRALSFS